MKSALALILFGTTALAQQPLPDIKPAALASHIRFLADDLLEGRETGTRGFELAARYVAAQFASFGLQPAGDDGSYFQQVRFRSAKIVAPRCTFVLHVGAATAVAGKRD